MKSHRVLVIGVGSIGERHLRCFHTTGRAELTFCEPNETLRRTIAERYGVEGYGSLDAALAAGRTFEAAVIATPAPSHIPIATRLAEAGLHLLIEKPLSTSLDGIDALEAAIARRGVTVAVAYVLRGHPVLRAMRAAIASGRFGRPLQVVAVSGQHFPKYRPAYREIYYTRHATGGGAIQDALTHSVNAVEWLVGPIDAVAADAAHQCLEGVEVEDTVHVLARHGDTLSVFTLNQYQAPNENTITVVAERGTARMEYHNGRWCSMTEPDTPWHEEMTFAGERDTLFVNQANAFLDAVEGKGPVDCTLAEAVHTLRVMLAILGSSQGSTLTPIVR
ncbi:MAG: Gfo/Idh/MocA family oxidoreductase [Phycisphaerae bacterium]|nr:Gfo/Idh/MocA family oxidoreductase [Phycisphaerae bacterium]